MRARTHRPSEISFDEQFYPARPRSFRRRQARPLATAADIQRLGPGQSREPEVRRLAASPVNAELRAGNGPALFRHQCHVA